jgi:hypothetical protein
MASVGITFNKDGTVDKRCSAVRSGFLSFNNDGTVDKRCAAFKRHVITEGPLTPTSIPIAGKAKKSIPRGSVSIKVGRRSAPLDPCI